MLTDQTSFVYIESKKLDPLTSADSTQGALQWVRLKKDNQLIRSLRSTVEIFSQAVTQQAKKTEKELKMFHGR